MITGWLLKVVLGIAFVGFAAIELGTPLIVRAQLDGTAHDAADDAAFTVFNRGSAEQAHQTAVERAAQDGAEVTQFSIDEQGRAHLTVRKQARSFILKNWDQTKSWYDVTVSATSQERRR